MIELGIITIIRTVDKEMFENDNNSLQYNKEIDGISITGWNEKNQKLQIPDRIQEVSVTKIEKRAFSEASWLMQLKLPESLQNIGDYAFCECRGLKELHFPKEIKRIGSHAFYNCRNIEKVTLPSNLRNIEDGAFKNCRKISTITLHVADESLHAMSHLFDELQQDVTIYLRYEDGTKAALFFPRDMILYSDYTSRLHNPVTYGMGYTYRQTAAFGKMDFLRYDGLFLGALNDLTSEQLREIAILRLMESYQLTEDAKLQYEKYVKTECMNLMREAIRLGDINRIDFLLQENYLIEEEAQDAYEFAKMQNQVEVSAKILQYKTKNFQKTDLEFEL